MPVAYFHFGVAAVPSTSPGSLFNACAKIDQLQILEARLELSAAYMRSTKGSMPLRPRILRPGITQAQPSAPRSHGPTEPTVALWSDLCLCAFNLAVHDEDLVLKKLGNK